MPNKTFNARVQMKRDTSTNWTSNNPVLLYGEIIIVDTDAGEIRYKVGNGTSTYTQLPFTDEAIINKMLSVNGGTMAGNINMNGHSVTGLAAPVNPTDAVRQQDLEVLSDEIDGIIAGTSPITLPIASDVRLGGVKVGEGVEITEDGTLNVNGFVPETRTVNGKALNQDISLSASDVGARPNTWTPSAADVGAMPAVSGGSTGQLLTKTAGGTAWQNKPAYTADEVGARPDTWTPTAEQVGARPDTWTPSAADVGAVPTTRTVNGQALSADITLDAEDVGARPSTWTPSAADVGAVPTSRTVNGKALSSNISLTAGDVGATELNGVTVTLTSSGWSATTGGFQQVVSVTGVTTDPDQIIWVDVSQSGTDLAADKALSEAWGAGPGQLKPKQQSGALQFFSIEKPTVNIPVDVVVSG